MKTTVARLTLVCVSLILITMLTSMGAKDVYALQDERLVGAWLFDEGDGKVAKDSSGKGHDGDFKGEPTPKWVEGKFGKALAFKGGTGSVVVPPSKDLDTLTTITIQAWVKLEKKGAWQIIVINGGPPRSYSLNISPDGFVEIVTEPTILGLLSEKEVVDGQWHHITGTFDKKALRTYVDGALSSEIPFTQSVTNSGPVTIGYYWEGNCCPIIDGIVDEVVIFNVGLTEGEIKRIMEGGLKATVMAVEPSDKLSTVWGRIKAAN